MGRRSSSDRSGSEHSRRLTVKQKTGTSARAGRTLMPKLYGSKPKNRNQYRKNLKKIRKIISHLKKSFANGTVLKSPLRKKQPYKSVAKQSSNKSTRNSDEYNPKQDTSTSCTLGIGELGKVSEALGFSSSFLNEVLSLAGDVLSHRGLKELIVIFIERKYYDIEEKSLKEKLSEELLKQVGFTDSEVIKTIMTRSEKVKQHFDLIDFIKRFINDEFKYNRTLIGIFRATDKLDPKEYRHFSDYRSEEQNEHCEVVLLFHGTDLYSAIDIMKNGIELDFGRHKHDFSNGGGFYLTTFEHAEKWARSQTRKPVVLELKIPKTCLEKARVLNLDVSRRKGRSKWERVVREHRSGRPSKKLRQEMKEYDCIQGPVSVPSQDADPPFKPEPGSYQLCVINRSFAKEIEENSKYTLYTEHQQ